MNTFRDYKELEDNIVDWMDRQDIRDKVASFIRLVTIDVSRELRIPTMVHTTIVPVYADGTAEVPRDLIEARSLNYLIIDEDGNINSRQPLKRASLNEYYKSREEENIGVNPDSFASVGGEFKVFPLPKVQDKIVNNEPINETQIGHLEVSYYVLPVTINDPTEDNWILKISPEIYFYGGLMHSCRYTRDYDSATYWENKYKTSIVKFQQSVDVSEWAGGPIVVEG